MIELEHIRKEFPQSTPVKDVSTVINNGDVVTVIGGSGCGKSTFLFTINMLKPPTSGKIILDGEWVNAPNYDMSLARRKIGMVFQNFNLFNHLTVLENCMAALMDLGGYSEEEARKKSLAMLKRVGMESRADRYPRNLSGGQKQRAAIARTLVMEPEIILFDEPTSALDPRSVDEVKEVIRDLADSGMTMMIVTHDMRLAEEIANRVFFMSEGYLYEEGTPEQIFHNPQKPLTKAFIRQAHCFTVRLKEKEPDMEKINGEFNKFCMNNDVDMRQANKIYSSFEELVLNLILPEMKDTVDISFVAEHTEEDIEVEIQYKGENIDIENGDQIAFGIFKHNAKDIKFERNDSEDMNRILFKIK